MLWNVIDIGKWTTSVLYNKLALFYWLVISWLVMQNNCKQSLYHTPVEKEQNQ